jgi:hypothetical protein
VTGPRSSRFLRLAAGLAISGTLLGAGATTASADATSDFNAGFALGQQAYEYGLPLLDTARVYATATSVSAPDGRGDGPVNEFSSVRRLTGPLETTVVAPNHDTLYSDAWLDLTHGPQVIHIPLIKHRFYVIPLYTPWTRDFYNITSAHGLPGHGAYGVTRGGNFAVVPPGFKGKLPHGVKRINSPYKRVWIIGRTYIRGAADTAAVNRVQDGYKITPLWKFGKPLAPNQAENLNQVPVAAHISGTGLGEDPIQFYIALDNALAQFPGPAADRPLLSQIKAIGVGPGLNPTTAGLSAATLQGMRAAVITGPATIQKQVVAMYVGTFAKYNGYLTGSFGQYGANYALRAAVDEIGLGALTDDMATYFIAQTDRTLAPLTGARRYVLHIPQSRLPIPGRAFWSLTMYNALGFLVPNRLQRFLLNDRSQLHYNADGSVDLYIQSSEPTNAAQAENWLPSPAGAFRVIWRLYDPGPALSGILSGTGWEPPAILACDATGHASDGTACAA